MSDYEIDRQIADMLKKSRNDSGKSQEFLSSKLEVSRKTIENWENGVKSPNMKMIVKWFSVLGLDMVRYMNPILHPAAEFSSTGTAESNREAVISIANSMSDEEITKLFNLMAGKYSGSAMSAMELSAAYLQLPLKDRICIAEHVILSYELAENSGDLRRIEGMEANTRMVHIAIRKAMEAVMNGEINYAALMEE